MRIVLPVLLLATAASAAETLAPATFAYDARAPLDLRDEAAALKKGDVTVRDVSFAAATPGERTRAFLVLPKEGDKHSAVLWVHWLGEPKTTNRTEFLDDAIELARTGTVSLLVDAQWSTPRWFKTRTTDGDYDASIRQVKDLRRALDALLAQPGIDPARVGFVGHDFGGMYGSLLAAVDPRARFYVIMAVTTKLSDWFLLGAPPKSKPDYVAKMAPLEPTLYLARARGGFLFQFAKNDEYVTRAHADEYVAAAQGDKQALFYDADHGLDVPAAHQDRITWLRAKLSH
jgi:dienelactone hydrolase